MARQAPDGCWPDYPDIEVGPSQAWTTAYVGFALSSGVPSRSVARGLARAVKRLHALEQPDGWGYNEGSACDADSTAWSIRFLNRHDALRGLDSRRLLSPYVGEEGLVRTFRASGRFGSWSHHSDEVAPILTLAWLETHVPYEPIQIITRRQFERANKPDTSMSSFWWECPEYALCWNAVLFERMSLPFPIGLMTWLELRFEDPPLEDIFATSLLVLAAPKEWVRHRVDIQQALISSMSEDRLMPSAWLLVPNQQGQAAPTRHLDTGSMTVATLHMALEKLRQVGC